MHCRQSLYRPAATSIASVGGVAPAELAELQGTSRVQLAVSLIQLRLYGDNQVSYSSVAMGSWDGWALDEPEDDPKHDAIVC